MTKDRDQLTPAEPEDADQLRPRRSAAREADRTEEPAGEAGHGPASAGTEPRGRDAVGGDEKPGYS